MASTPPKMTAASPREPGRSRLDAFADRVSAFWGVSMPVVVGDEGPATDWHVVLMPADWEAMADEQVLCVLLHEWGHRTLAPVGIVQALYWELLAKLCGIRASHEAVNLATDLVIDLFYALHPMWRSAYGPFVREEVDDLLRSEGLTAQGARDPLGQLLAGCYLDLLARAGVELEHASHVDRELATSANVLLFDEQRTLDERLRAFFEVVAPVFRSSRMGSRREGVGPQRHRKGPGGGRVMALAGRPCAWREAKWDANELVRLLASSGVTVPDQVLNEVCGALAPEVRARLRVVRSLSRVERAVARLQRRLTGDRQENSVMWRVGDSLRTLDPVLTLERSARLIPGVTTLRRTRAVSPQDSPGLGALWLVVDNSGSTAGMVIDTILDAAVGLLEAARRLNVPAGLFVFGSGIVAEVPLGREYDRIGVLLASLEGQSGGTELAPALRAALRGAERASTGLATVVFTDSYVYDVGACVTPLQDLSARGPMVLFCVEDRLDEELMAAVSAMAVKPRVIKHHPGEPLVDAALEVFEA